MNRFRVDRSDGLYVPCGMNSILYIGDSERLALRAFAQAQPGLNKSSQPNDSYGVVFSEWRGSHSVGEYVVRRSKFPQEIAT
jgi:hypothetical protein